MIVYASNFNWFCFTSIAEHGKKFKRIFSKNTHFKNEHFVNFCHLHHGHVTHPIHKIFKTNYYLLAATFVRIRENTTKWEC